MAKRKSVGRTTGKNGTTKAQSIRDTAKELGRKARPKDIIAALAAKNIVVTSPQVISALKTGGLYRKRRKVRPAAGTMKPSVNGRSPALNIDDLVRVKKLANEIGGIAKVKAAVAALERLQR